MSQNRQLTRRCFPSPSPDERTGTTVDEALRGTTESVSNIAAQLPVTELAAARARLLAVRSGDPAQSVVLLGILWSRE